MCNLQTRCFRCRKNTWYVESNYILQPPEYLISVVNKKKTLCYNDSKITEFERIDNKNSSTAYVVMYKLITYWFSD